MADVVFKIVYNKLPRIIKESEQAMRVGGEALAKELKARLPKV